jgi:hypothetical protein
MLDVGGHFAEVTDPIAGVLRPMCINLVVGMGAKRKAAYTASETAEAAWSKFLGA